MIFHLFLLLQAVAFELVVLVLIVAHRQNQKDLVLVFVV
jgi:hypothetical protein